MIFELSADFRDALAEMPKDHSKHRIVELLDKAIRRDSSFIIQHPQLLLQCLWHRCYWYDAPETKIYYQREISQTDAENFEHPWNQAGEKLWELAFRWLGRWRKQRAGCPWLRSNRPPRLSLSSNLITAMQLEDEIVSLAISADGKRGVSATKLGTMQLCDLSTANVLAIRRSGDGEAWPLRLAISSDGHRIVGGTSDHTILVWDADLSHELAVLRGHEGEVLSVAMTDGIHIASGSEDHTVCLWDAATRGKARTFRGHDDSVNSVAITRNGHCVVSGSSDDTIRVWSMDSERERLILRGHEGSVTGVAISADCRWIVSSSMDSTVRVWAFETGEELVVLRGHQYGVNCVAISADGLTVVSGGRDGTIRVWDPHSGRELAVLPVQKLFVLCVAVSANGKRIISGSLDGTVRVWGTDHAWLRSVPDKPMVREVVLSSDGKRLVSVTLDGTVTVWELESGRELAVVKHQSHIAMTPNGKLIASADGALVRVWETDTGREIQVFRGHKEEVWEIGISNDGNRVVSMSCDREVRSWDVKSGCELAVLTLRLLFRQHDHHVPDHVAISPDGIEISTQQNFRRTIRWDAATGETLGDANAHSEKSEKNMKLDLPEHLVWPGSSVTTCESGIYAAVVEDNQVIPCKVERPG